ncbi:calcium-binding protein [Alteromonas genovensis]|jgi:Ca2+-binding EF-hand superfamily protein|uniref:Calcium-binding protein n=1 Tax=Alteromonas genovensis TaxID=471225 RepID=A0A6N9TG37_9ALTE|nr:MULTISPECIES: calcium-binding protein [Alteromonas]MAI38694.1 calcium-binding protein [Alteromonas sp.]NDW14886.1 calcium-binding protein [Alteromonas genovensis]OUX85443.1 MAG: calcium-binding protein [Alteromonas sp. TMED35]|tara:strand:- start:3686 stop:3982 length:297 start_codon:yes stop_codon:yes gene_type:complete
MKISGRNIFTLLAVMMLQVSFVASVSASPANTLMQKLDKDKDGFISLKEAVQHIELLRNFGLIDDNEDGKLTEKELAKSKLTPKTNDANNSVTAALKQ